MNELPSGYKCTQSFLKATLYSAHGSAYHFRFRNPTRSEMIKRFVTSKIISKINAMHPAHHVFNKMTKTLV